MVSIGRPIGGITLNGLEFVLDDKGDVMLFDDEDAAKEFLRSHGYKDNEIDDLVFQEDGRV